VIVVDASVMLEYLFTTDRGTFVAERLDDSAEAAAAPCLLDVEVAQVLRRWCLTGRVGQERAVMALEDLSDFNAVRWPHEPLMWRIWELRHNFTAYDATYVALAEILGATLLTCDRAQAHRDVINCDVELIE
jgi:predicted nucleic acid-binding protein